MALSRTRVPASGTLQAVASWNARHKIGWRSCFGFLLGLSFLALPLAAQQQYTGTNVTGALTLTGTVNLQQVQTPAASNTGLATRSTQEFVTDRNAPELMPPIPERLLSPVSRVAQMPVPYSTPITTTTVSLNAIASSAAVQFNGLSHLDQRLANGGNQFNTEPPNPSVAAGNGFVLEGVNNAIQVYDTSGVPLLSSVVTSNQLFGLAPEINQTTAVHGVFPTDMRVFFDSTVSRWFVIQRARDNDSSGTPLNSSHIYIAVSQTADPTATYNVYTMNTTSPGRTGCPCLSDYPQIGADQYGFYISTNQFNIATGNFVDVSVLAISKGSLSAGATAPTAFEFVIPTGAGFEFTIQPATTPPGASNFVQDGGVEFFASTTPAAGANQLAIWAMSNTSSLAFGQPNPVLLENFIPTLNYSSPQSATQPEGLRPYGSSLVPPGPLPFIDGGDTRVLSLSYAGGNLYVTFATNVPDPVTSASLVGGAFVVLTPTIQNGVVSVTALSQSYLVVENNHLLRPAIAVNAQGQGVIAATLVGPNWYPSAAFIPIDGPSTPPSIILITAPGGMPEDGFTGYPGGGVQGTARWGDYSSATVASDGSVWMAQEYIGNLPRTQMANWDTFIESVTPPVGPPVTSSPSPVAMNPPSGSGSSQVFEFTFSDNAGYQALGVVNVLINNFLDGRHACYVAYSVPTNTLSLVDDAGDAGGPFAGSLVLNGSGSASNSQCTINGVNSTATGSGQVLTLTLSITFNSGFARNAIAYLAARDTGTGNSGWQAIGTWTVPGSVTNGPAVGGVTPARSGTLSDSYSFTFTDSNGWADIAITNILINDFIDGRSACYLAFVPLSATSGSLYLVDDAGDAGGPFAGMLLLPGNGTISNGQCTVAAVGASVLGTGNSLTVTLPVTFSQSFAGSRVFFLATRSNTANSDWHAEGTVTVPR